MNEALNVKDMKLYSEADSIFADLTALGFPAGSALDVNVVSQIDQLHYHGTASVHQAIDMLGITDTATVLEVGAGWGGPSRYIAAKSGAQVTALELQQDFSTVGETLTQRCALSSLVTHRRDDFLTVDFGDVRFDHVGSWLALYHIPDRARYTAKIADLLKPGGTVFVEDLSRGTAFDRADQTTLDRELFASSMVSYEDYISSLTHAGFDILSAQDMTANWRAFTTERLETFIGNRDAFLRVHDEALFEDKKHFYSKIVEYFTANAIGGIQIAAKKR